MHVVLTVRCNAVVQTHRPEAPPLINPEGNRVSDELAVVNFYTNEDVSARNSRDRSDMFPGSSGHGSQTRAATGADDVPASRHSARKRSLEDRYIFRPEPARRRTSFRLIGEPST